MRLESRSRRQCRNRASPSRPHTSEWLSWAVCLLSAIVTCDSSHITISDRENEACVERHGVKEYGREVPGWWWWGREGGRRGGGGGGGWGSKKLTKFAPTLFYCNNSWHWVRDWPRETRPFFDTLQMLNSTPNDQTNADNRRMTSILSW